MPPLGPRFRGGGDLPSRGQRPALRGLPNSRLLPLSGLPLNLLYSGDILRFLGGERLPPILLGDQLRDLESLDLLGDLVLLGERFLWGDLLLTGDLFLVGDLPLY